MHTSLYSLRAVCTLPLRIAHRKRCNIGTIQARKFFNARKTNQNWVSCNEAKLLLLVIRYDINYLAIKFTVILTRAVLISGSYPKVNGKYGKASGSVKKIVRPPPTPPPTPLPNPPHPNCVIVTKQENLQEEGSFWGLLWKRVVLGRVAPLFQRSQMEWTGTRLFPLNYSCFLPVGIENDAENSIYVPETVKSTSIFASWKLKLIPSHQKGLWIFSLTSGSVSRSVRSHFVVIFVTTFEQPDCCSPCDATERHGRGGAGPRGARGGWGLNPTSTLLGKVVHIFFSTTRTHCRRRKAHKNVAFSKFIMHFQSLERD